MCFLAEIGFMHWFVLAICWEIADFLSQLNPMQPRPQDYLPRGRGGCITLGPINVGLRLPVF